MKNSIKVLGALVLLSFLTINSYAATPATEKSVKELMVLTGAGDMGVQMMQGMIPALKQMAPQLPESFWTNFAKEVNPNEVVDLIIPIYAKHFTEEEIQEAIKFYKSPAGRKMIQEQPQVMQESMAVGQEWGRKLAEKVMEKAKKAQAEQKPK
jgi:uncharacterized protein